MNINPKVIDIYHGDSVLSFDQAHTFGIRGVIHKATEGATNTDHLYLNRRSAAIRAGMLWGAYHFLRPGNMVDQAKRFVDTAKPDATELMALDHEDGGVALQEARVFMEQVESEIGRQVVVYSGFLIKEQIPSAPDFDVAFFAARRLWLSHYSAIPKWPKIWVKPWLWQFTGDGAGPQPHAVPGIQDKMDVNSYDGTDEQLAAEWAGEPLAQEPLAQGA
jgi:GH25 family lysozyme M1 (1,4-beta-N-acetylmuramidase)